MTSGVYMSAIQGENGGRGSYVYTKNMMATCTLQLGPMLLQTYTMACFKWRKNCNSRTQNR